MLITLLLAQAAASTVTSHAAIAVFDSGVNAQVGIGSVLKPSVNPLFNQSKPWEPRIDNGYPNVVHDPSNAASPFQLWYGDCVTNNGGCGQQSILYANSTDGLVWNKPALGLVDVGALDPNLAHIGKLNNIVMKGGGTGVFLDAHETNASRRYKAFGEACFGGLTGCSPGTAVSADGHTFTDATPIAWPAPQRYDCHNNVFFDAINRTYVATTRDGFSGPVGRTIAVQRSLPNDYAWTSSTAPPSVFRGDADHQLYSMVPFPFHDAFLGIVMVYDATSAAQRVHCRLAWSHNTSVWEWVDAGGLTGHDIIPLGTQGSCAFEPVTVAGHTLSDCDAYKKGQTPLHYVCKGDRQSVGEVPRDECLSACGASPVCGVMQWQGEAAHNFSATAPGQCFLYPSCDTVEPYDSPKASSFCVDVERCTARTGNAFDSHICFAAATPVKVGNTTRVYYMGGNGPHSGARNSSFAMVELREDGFAGVFVTGGGNFTTHPLAVTGSRLLVTADVLSAGGRVQVGVMGVRGLTPLEATPITANVTNAGVQFPGNGTLAPLAGRHVILGVVATDAVVYTISFAEES